MIIVKLGGSVITNKDRENKARRRTIKRLINEIKLSGKRIIMVHGAGSFGHIPAKRYQLDKGFRDLEQLGGVHYTHNSVRKLNLLIMDLLYEGGIPSISIPPISFLIMSEGKVKNIDYEVFDRSFSMGLTPVTFGDIVFDDKRGFSICSGDLLVLHLARHFKPERAIFVVDEDGIFDKDPKKNRDSHLIRSINFHDIPEGEGSSYEDVTGGMKGKIDSIKAIGKSGIEVLVINGNKKDRLYGALIGKKVKGTYVGGDR